jgi:hypothetical protein
MKPLRALRMHANRGKAESTLMTDRIIWRVRRREVAPVSAMIVENRRRVCNASFRETGSETLGCKGHSSPALRLPTAARPGLRAPVRLRERGTVSIYRPSPAFPPLRGREGKCERRHEHLTKPRQRGTPPQRCAHQAQ